MTRRSRRSSERPLARIGAAAAIATLLIAPARSESPSLDQVLARAAGYVARFERRLSRLVGEEDYTQHVRQFAPGPGRLVNPMQVELKSNLALVRTAPTHGWVQVRDVFEVDGKPVRDRSDRLSRVLADPRAADRQIEEILADNSRFNIGDVHRNINIPLLALQFLERDTQSRFRFTRSRDRTPSTAVQDPPHDGAFRVSVEMWAVEYVEKERPTIIRTPTRKDLPARGRFWIDPAGGRVLMSELAVEDRDIRATIDVSYQSEPLLDMLVPVEMRERYEGRRDRSLIEARATYARFRPVSLAGPPSR